MAIVAVYTHENCPGVPKGARVMINTADALPDQAAAWAHAREVHNRIYWEHVRREQEKTKQDSI